MLISKTAAKKDACRRAKTYRDHNKGLPAIIPFKIWKVRQIQEIPAGDKLVRVIGGMIP